MQSNIPASSAGVVLGAQQLKVLRNTYLLLALTMVPTIIGAFGLQLLILNSQSRRILLTHQCAPTALIPAQFNGPSIKVF